MMDDLQREGRWDEQIATQRTALDAASRAGDRVGRAHALRNLALGVRPGRPPGPGTASRRRAGGVRGAPDLVGQARSHGNLALVLIRRG
ncbi:Regulatory protein AfsR OS=Streptomyces microflavus OX=1919 GN=afsR PE=3 SV=1 [Streptomyces microflavus]